jgi:hypothetical protein
MTTLKLFLKYATLRDYLLAGNTVAVFTSRLITRLLAFTKGHSYSGSAVATRST